MSQVSDVSPGLLVSVRSATEALAALSGGADLIDVKEPDRGSLGRASHAVISDVVATVERRVPVSAALGEWGEGPFSALPAGITYVKCGLAGVSASSAVVREWRESAIGAQPVLVAYADHRRAGSPDPVDLAAAACDLGFPVFLIDTATKDGSTLTDWIDGQTLGRMRRQLGRAAVRVALAGCLDSAQISSLLPVAPDWFAIRGAACSGGRSGHICTERVRGIKALLSSRRAG